MNDLISRQVAIGAIEEYGDRLQMVNWNENPGVPYKVHALNWCVNTIRDLPTAVAEVKRGRWNENGNCSNCGKYYGGLFIMKPSWNYCPNCGAKMQGEDNDD